MICDMSDSQRLQSPDTRSGGDCSCQEWKESRARLAKTSDPADAPCQEPVWQDPCRMIHDDRVDRAQEHANEGNG